MIICFDLDGTLYNSLPDSIIYENKVAKLMNHSEITIEQFKKVFQSRDWIKYYRDLGYSEIEAEEALAKWYVIAEEWPVPKLIPGAKELLTFVERLVGRNKIFILTNADNKSIKKRFEQDDLMHFYKDLRRDEEGKAHLILDLAKQNKETTIVYVGDTVFDGEECLKAKNAGYSIKFVAIAHDYAFNTKEMLVEFITKHDWSYLVDNFEKMKLLLVKLNQ